MAANSPSGLREKSVPFGRSCSWIGSPVDDPVGLDLDGDCAGRVGEDTEGEQDEKETVRTITDRWRGIEG